jgi:hypothetical protein
MDWPGAVLACAGLFAIVFGFSQAETAGWTALLTLGSLVGGVVLIVGFVVAERRVPHPLLPLRVILTAPAAAPMSLSASREWRSSAHSCS